MVLEVKLGPGWAWVDLRVGLSWGWDWISG